MRSINIYLLRMLIIGNHNVLATHATALIGMVRLSPTALWLHTAQWSDSEQREYFRVELLVSMNIYHLSTNIHNEGTILKSYHFLLKGWHGMIGQGTGVYFYFFYLFIHIIVYHYCFFFNNSKICIWAKCCMLANYPERMSLFLVTSRSCTGHSSCASTVKF